MPQPDPSDTAKAEIAEPAAEPVWRRMFRRLGPAGPVALLFLVGPPLGLLTLGFYAGTVSEWFGSLGPAGLVLYAVLFALLAGVALLPTHIQCGVAGYAFGVVSGSIVTMVGITGAAMIGYEIARRASGDRVLAMISEKPKWRAIRDALVGVDARGHGFWRTLGLIALVRIPPSSPFALTNLVMASVKAPWVAFIVGTVIGIAPRALFAVVIGNGIREAQRALTRDAITEGMWIKLGVSLVVFAIIYWIADRTIKRITASQSAEQTVQSTS